MSTRRVRSPAAGTPCATGWPARAGEGAGRAAVAAWWAAVPTDWQETRRSAPRCCTIAAGSANGRTPGLARWPTLRGPSPSHIQPEHGPLAHLELRDLAEESGLPQDVSLVRHQARALQFGRKRQLKLQVQAQLLRGGRARSTGCRRWPQRGAGTRGHRPANASHPMGAAGAAHALPPLTLAMPPGSSTSSHDREAAAATSDALGAGAASGALRPLGGAADGSGQMASSCPDTST